MENFRLYNNYKTSAVYMAVYILKMNTSFGEQINVLQ